MTFGTESFGDEVLGTSLGGSTTPVSVSLKSSYMVNAKVANQIRVIYNIPNKVINSVKSLYDIESKVSSSLKVKWINEVRVSTSLISRYNVNEKVSSSIKIGWDIPGPIVLSTKANIVKLPSVNRKVSFRK